ncbi:hypothetical protein [Burkholderia cepacia]|uniref:hypothetical protein n=1 Tax=Burkholderia cepacia TaxID=292 RepID=UPI000A963399|nr:hypothetical protein [Burkholderia cepacia]
MFNKKIPSLPFVSLFVFCALSAGTQPVLAQQPTLGPVETRVFYDSKCAFMPLPDSQNENPLLLAIAAAVIPALISQATSSIGNTLKASSAAKTNPVTATTNLVISNSVLPQCIQIVRGQFSGAHWGLSGSDPLITRAPDWFAEGMSDASRDDGRQITKLDIDHIWDTLGQITSKSGVLLSQWPDFVVEIVVRDWQGHKALTAAPLFAAYGRPILSRMFRSNSRNVQISFSIAAPGKAASSGSGEITLGLLKPGTAQYYNLDALNRITNWNTPKPPAKQVTKDPNAPMVKESPLFVPTIDANGPNVITAVSTEAQDASEFLTFVSGVFASAAPAINTALTNAADSLLPKSSEQQLADAQTATTNDGKYASAVTSAFTALQTCAALEWTGAPPTDQATQVKIASSVVAAASAQRAANTAADTAGKGHPHVFADSDIVLPGTANGPMQCKTALANSLKTYSQ